MCAGFIVGMALRTRIARAVGISRAEAPKASAHPSLTPPARTLVLSDARTLIPVYRAIQVLTTAAAQLPITIERRGATLTGASVPAIVSQPDPRMTRGEWITHMVTALALYGNAYALIERDPAGSPIALRPLDPSRVWVSINPTTRALRFGVEGKELTSFDVLHAHLQPARIGEPLGLGPIEAARADLMGARDVRDYASQWFTGTGEPTGILSSPTATLAEAMATRDAWNGLDQDGNPVDQSANPTRVKVLPKAFTYSHLAISPRDAQWLEAREFSTLEIARLFGIPSTLMLASPTGGSMSYSNVEQDWISFIRFTLMAYLRPLEEAFTTVTVRGQDVRFNLEGLLRTDTKTRYDSYAVALANGFLTIDEIRALEGRQPLPTTQEETV